MTTQDFGTVEHDRKTLKITQQPYINGSGEDAHYRAIAVDGLTGNEYMIRWECLEGYESLEDESDRCDWSRFTVVAQ